MIDEIKVRLVPATISESESDGHVVVMVDVLRASTTMIQSLANGAAAIYPRAEIEESRKLSRQLGDIAVLGGERNGKVIDGFDCGNSPIEYSRECIEGKSLVLCTTNGTYTLEHCRSAQRLIIGAFANLSAICRFASRHEKLLIACAGTNRMVSDEDVLFAGALINQLLQTHRHLRLDDGATIAASRWQSIKPILDSGTPLWEVLAKSHGGRNLMRLGYEHDIQFCANIDTVQLIPELNLESWIIRPAVTPT